MKKKVIFVLIVLLVLSFFLVFKYRNNAKACYDAKRNCKEVFERFNFIDLINVVLQYDPTKQWYEFAEKTHKEVVKNARLDENGIALNVREKKAEYNPVTISQYGLNNYGFYILYNDESYLKIAIKQADYLVEMQDKENGNFYYYFDYFVYGTDETLKSPWISAMAIGNILSLYSRIYSVTKDQKYIDSANLALKPLRMEVSEGGLVSYFDGHKFYEEYPTTKGNFTLNGFMFTLIGLYDYVTVTGNAVAKKLYDEGLETLKYVLPYYDSAGISLYHLAHLYYPNQAAYYNRKYHVIHIAQLDLFYQIDGSEIFKHYSE
ncbi:MAG: D-glucuronyl C5-epimerase family protein, partial [Endomicrobiaceae bacterium]